MIDLRVNAGNVISTIHAQLEIHAVKLRNIRFLIPADLFARNAIVGILRMSAQTFLNSLATGAPERLMYVTLVQNSALAF